MSRVMSRRRWLHLAGGTLASLGIAGRLYAAPQGGPRFLLVFLRGGYDATNTLIPYSSDFYYEARPTIAIPRPDPSADTGAVVLDADWALAPALRESIGALYQQRQVAFVPFTGTPDLSRSSCPSTRRCRGSARRRCAGRVRAGHRSLRPRTWPGASPV